MFLGRAAAVWPVMQEMTNNPELLLRSIWPLIPGRPGGSDTSWRRCHRLHTELCSASVFRPHIPAIVFHLSMLELLLLSPSLAQPHVSGHVLFPSSCIRVSAGTSGHAAEWSRLGCYCQLCEAQSSRAELGGPSAPGTLQPPPPEHTTTLTPWRLWGDEAMHR